LNRATQPCLEGAKVDGASANLHSPNQPCDIYRNDLFSYLAISKMDSVKTLRFSCYDPVIKAKLEKEFRLEDAMRLPEGEEAFKLTAKQWF